MINVSVRNVKHVLVAILNEFYGGHNQGAIFHEVYPRIIKPYAPRTWPKPRQFYPIARVSFCCLKKPKNYYSWAPVNQPNRQPLDTCGNSNPRSGWSCIEQVGLEIGTLEVQRYHLEMLTYLQLRRRWHSPIHAVTFGTDSSKKITLMLRHKRHWNKFNAHED